MCLGAIYWARPKKVWFAATRHDAAEAGFDDSEIYRELTLPDHEKKIPMEQLMKEEAESVFKIWIDLEHKIEY
jgi:tRNA(Arg) A34 adenosine deaminase TadA